jgi:hypothetical protein
MSGVPTTMSVVDQASLEERNAALNSVFPPDVAILVSAEADRCQSPPRQARPRPDNQDPPPAPKKSRVNPGNGSVVPFPGFDNHPPPPPPGGPGIDL